MPKQKSDVNKSEEIRQLFKSDPTMPVKEVVATLAGRGIKVADTLVYYVKGKMKGYASIVAERRRDPGGHGASTRGAAC